MRYANHECSGCGLVLPANELERVHETVKTGHSKSMRRSKPTQLFEHLGTTEHYSKRSKWLCPTCSRKRLLGKLAIVVGIAALYGWARLTDHAAPSPPPTSHNEAQVEQAAPVEQEAGFGMESETGDASAPTATGQDQADRVYPADEPRSSVSSDGSELPQTPPLPTTATQIIEAPTSFAQVSDAMDRAAAHGQPQRWKVGKVNGYAVPSAAGVDGCRMVQITLNDDGAQSAAQKLCPSEEAEHG